MSSRGLAERTYPELKDEQLELLSRFEGLLREKNQKVNLVSRKEEAFTERHILPSLFPLKILNPPRDAHVADIGTGGGLPGIPLAIAYPGMNFLLIDSTRKKLDAIEEMIQELELENVRTEHHRVEQAKFRADLITGRAVTALPRFVAWCRSHLAECSQGKGDRGVLYWTGGDDVEKVLKEVKGEKKAFSMKDYLEVPELESKKVVFIIPNS